MLKEYDTIVTDYMIENSNDVVHPSSFFGRSGFLSSLLFWLTSISTAFISTCGIILLYWSPVILFGIFLYYNRDRLAEAAARQRHNRNQYRGRYRPHQD